MEIEDENHKMEVLEAAIDFQKINYCNSIFEILDMHPAVQK